MLFERLYKAFGGVALAMFEAGSMVTTTYLIGGIAILLMAVLIPELVGLWNKLDEYFFAQVREVQVRFAISALLFLYCLAHCILSLVTDLYLYNPRPWPSC
jgi:hypothetical protein